jgi:hypothetical protein
LLALFEAARWAPSAYNAQPWRFLYARRNSAHWETFLGLLLPFNQAWASRAAALIVLVSNPIFLPPGADNPVTLRSSFARCRCCMGKLGIASNPRRVAGARHGWFRRRTCRDRTQGAVEPHG